MKMTSFALAGLLAVSASAMAQNPNSPNSAQYHAIRNPNSPYSPYSNAQQPSQPPVKWADRWGALAEDGEGILGVAVDAVNKGEAGSLAIADCENRGGRRCEVSLTYYNQCAVVVAGNEGSNISHAATKEEATALAMKGCEARDGAGACRVYYSGCSLPVQVQ